MYKNFFAVILCILVMNACSIFKNHDMNSASDHSSRANELAHQFIITDGHVDLPYRLRVQNFKLEKEYLGIPIETEKGDFDYKRAKEGGLDAPFMSIFIPASYQRNGGSKLLADSLIDMVSGIAIAHPEYYKIVKSPAEVQACFNEGIVALPMGMENGAPIEGDLSNIEYFKNRGISYITLTHSKDNHICDSSYDTTGTWQGLSPFGIQVVEEMNKKGVMIDISHVSDKTFYQVMDLTKVPVIASHSSCRKYTPGFERNMDDAMIRKLAENNGVIQINFGSTFLDKKVADQRNENRKKLQALLAENEATRESEVGKALIERFEKENPNLFSDVKMVANHIDHVVALAGIDHVGLGSDYDGVGDSLPVGLKDVSDYPNLIEELLIRGYSEEDIEKICSKNVFRVWQTVLDYSKN